MCAAIETGGIWFGSGERPALGWLSRPSGAGSGSGIVVLPPVAYAYWSVHRTLRVIAERLAGEGHLVLRVDYDGTGDSAGDQWEPDRLDAWRRTVGAAAELLRSAGARDLLAVGVQLGATLALLDSAEHDFGRVVAWAPVLSGRRFVRQLRLLSQEVPTAEEPHGREGTHAMAGTVFSAETAADLARLDLGGLSPSPRLRALVVERTDEAADAAASPLRAAGAAVDVHVSPAAGELLETAPEFAVTPADLVDAIASWVGPGAAGAGAVPFRLAATFDWRGGAVEETVVELPGAGHVGILTAPAEEPAEAGGPTLVLLNPGSETHIGPGRAWVELCRDLALRGHRCARVDFLGWGESPDAGRAPGRPYDQVGVADAGAIAQAIKELHDAPVVLFGLCASAWIALRAVLGSEVDGAIALNPQMYWKPGDPVDIDWNRIRERRRDEIERVARGARLGVWSALDRLGHRPRVARWLDELSRCGSPVELLFAEGDDGLVYLRQRVGRRLVSLERRGALRVTELPGVDHPLHRAWVRPRVTEALDAALARISSRLPGGSRSPAAAL